MASSLTVSLLTDRIKQNVGNRYTGRIGASTFEDTVLAKLNNVVMAIGRDFWYIPELQRKASIDVSSSGYSYSLPTVDEDSNTIRIRAITRATIVKDGESQGYSLVRLSEQERGSYFPRTSSDIAQTYPKYYSEIAGKVELYPYPDGDYTVELVVTIYPTFLTVNSTLPYGDEWNDCIEAGVTGQIFASLMLPDDATLWNRAYIDRMRSIKESMRQKPNWKPGFYICDGIVSQDPVNDPFVRSYNSRR